MNWYWVENNERRGPVTDEALRALVASGRVGPETLVWREGFEAWTPWRQAQPEPVAVPPPDAAPPQRPEARPKPAAAVDPGATVAISSAAFIAAAAAPGPASDRPAAELDSCTQCSRILPKDELMRFENDRVCAQCKPLYLQRLKEGVRPSTNLVYAGFWVRLGAKIIDGFILGVPLMLIVFFLMPGFINMSPGANPNLGPTCLLQLVLYALSAAYSVFFVGRFGATPGKMALKLKIVRPDGSRVTYARAFGRFFAEFLSGIILYIGYIMAAFDEEKRSLHDRICDTRVVRA